MTGLALAHALVNAQILATCPAVPEVAEDVVQKGANLGQGVKARVCGISHHVGGLDKMQVAQMLQERVLPTVYTRQPQYTPTASYTNVPVA